MDFKRSQIRKAAFGLTCILVVAFAIVAVLHREPRSAADKRTVNEVVAAKDASGRASEPRQTAQADDATSASSSNPDGISAAISVCWRFANVATTKLAGDDSQWAALYPPEKLPEIRNFNLMHPFAWTVHSGQQIAWMAANGFPMPEDVFAADAMNREQLRRAADAGGPKAQMLYYDRLMSERELALDAWKQEGNSVENFSQSQPALEAEWQRMWQVVAQIDSPYVGYLEAARAQWIDDRDARAQAFAGGLALAYFRGDDRAGNAILSATANGDLTDQEAELAYRIVSQIRNYYPLPDGCGPNSSTPFAKP